MTEVTVIINDRHIRIDIPPGSVLRIEGRAFLVRSVEMEITPTVSKASADPPINRGPPPSIAFEAMPDPQFSFGFRPDIAEDYWILGRIVWYFIQNSGNEWITTRELGPLLRPYAVSCFDPSWDRAKLDSRLQTMLTRLVKYKYIEREPLLDETAEKKRHVWKFRTLKPSPSATSSPKSSANGQHSDFERPAEPFI